MWADRPWVGQGPGHYELAYPRYRLPRWPEPLGHAHNLYLHLLAETGLVGLTAYLLLLGSFALVALRAALAPATPLQAALGLGAVGVLAALAFHSLIDNLYVHDLTVQLGLVVGLTVAAGAGVSDERPMVPGRARPGKATRGRRSRTSASRGTTQGRRSRTSASRRATRWRRSRTWRPGTAPTDGRSGRRGAGGTARLRRRPARRAAPSLASRFKSRRTLVSLAVTVVLLALFLRRLGVEELSRSWEMIRQANPAVYLAALVIYYLAFPIRGHRWRVLLVNSGEPPERIPSIRDLSEIIYLSWFANSHRAGQAGRCLPRLAPAALRRHHVVPRAWAPSWPSGPSTLHRAGRAHGGRGLAHLRGRAGRRRARRSLGLPRAASTPRRPAAPCCSSSRWASSSRWRWWSAWSSSPATACTSSVSYPGGWAIYVRFAGALVLSFGRFPRLIVSRRWPGCARAELLAGGRRPGLQAAAAPGHLLQPAAGLHHRDPAHRRRPGLRGAHPRRRADPARLPGQPGRGPGALYRTISYFSLVVGGAIVYLRSKKTR